MEPRLYLSGALSQIPPENTALAVYRSRLFELTRKYLEETNKNSPGIAGKYVDISLDVHSRTSGARPGSSEPSIEERARKYHTSRPLYSREHLILPDRVMEELLSAIDMISYVPLIFDSWGLKAIEPFPRSVLNFAGDPGTGKTLAAHWVAHWLGRMIMTASYADIESSYHGEGPKNIQALFYAAQKTNAVLFIDEADSLLSKRLVQVTQASEQAINSMRSQLLISLQEFEGIVIFASNHVQSYDKAFETRVRQIVFPMPDYETRVRLWRLHLVPQLPLAPDVNISALAAIDGVCGRDIKNAVLYAAVDAARRRTNVVTMDMLRQHIKAAHHPHAGVGDQS